MIYFFLYTSDLGTEVIQVNETFLLYLQITSRWPLVRKKHFGSVKAQATNSGYLQMLLHWPSSGYITRCLNFHCSVDTPSEKEQFPPVPKPLFVATCSFQLARIITLSVLPHPIFLAKAVDLPKDTGMGQFLNEQLLLAYFKQTLPTILSEPHSCSL